MLSDLPSSSHQLEVNLSRHESVSSLMSQEPGGFFGGLETGSVTSELGGSDTGSVLSEPEHEEADLEGDARQLEEKTSQLEQVQVQHCNSWQATINIVEKEALDPSMKPEDCKLQILNLSHNSFKVVPPCLACLAPHLSRLYMAYNSLTTVGPLSRYLQSVKHLDLAHNQVPSTSLR